MKSKAIVLLTLMLALTGCKDNDMEAKEGDPLEEQKLVMQDVRKLKKEVIKIPLMEEVEKDESKETEQSSGENSKDLSDQGTVQKDQEVKEAKESEVKEKQESKPATNKPKDKQEGGFQFKDLVEPKEHKKFHEYVEYIDFKVVEQEDDSLEQGKTYIKQDGKRGYRRMLTTVFYKGDERIDEKTEVLYEEKPKDKIVLVGTKVKSEGYFDLAFAKSAFNETNKQKAANPDRNLSEFGNFVWDDDLYAAAEIRAKEAAESFGHQRPDGSGWHTVHPDVMAENLAYGQNSVEGLVRDWLASPTHAANIFSDYQYMAIATYVNENGVRFSAQLFR